jgi:uncharacterized repeat protein (TIGR03803 family)
MKTCVNKLFALPFLVIALNLFLCRLVTAQTCTDLHIFNSTDGAYPYAGLILSGHILYATTSGYGSSSQGMIFRVNTDGSNFTNLYKFSITTTKSATNSDGAYPYAGLILSGNTLYGTTEAGGRFGYGTVFSINTDGHSFTNLHSFSALLSGINRDGARPYSGLLLAGNTLYGTTYYGGSSGAGTVFAVNTNGTGFTNLHNFYIYGANSKAGLVLSSNTLYGTTYNESVYGDGTIFKVNTDGSDFTNLHLFDASSENGFSPKAGLVLSGGTLYGTTELSVGSLRKGTVFKINTDGSGFTNLYTFSGSDGANPEAGVIVLGGTLFGTTYGGGSSGAGTVFAVNTDGSGFTNIYNFGGSGGANPEAGLVALGSTLFGTTASGVGDSTYGTVFALSLVPSLGIAVSSNQVILSWPTWAPNYGLQCTTNIIPPIVWSAVLPQPIIVNGQNTVTNPITGEQIFYRLSQ